MSCITQGQLGPGQAMNIGICWISTPRFGVDLGKQWEYHCYVEDFFLQLWDPDTVNDVKAQMEKVIIKQEAIILALKTILYYIFLDLFLYCVTLNLKNRILWFEMYKSMTHCAAIK